MFKSLFGKKRAVRGAFSGSKREWLESRQQSDMRDLMALRDALYEGHRRITDVPALRASVVRLLSSPAEAARDAVRRMVEFDESVVKEAEEYALKEKRGDA